MAPLVIVDVDEVLAMFMRAFGRFVAGRGLELHLERYALFENIFRPGEVQHLEVAAGRALFDAFFNSDAKAIDAAPGASQALAGLSLNAGVIVLTNAPGHSRAAPARWLKRHGFPYPLVVNRRLKGPPVAALAARTRGAAAFIDDLLPNLESVALAAPAVHRFQLVADARLAALAFAAPHRHRRIDDSPALSEAIAATLDLPRRRV